MPRRFPRSLAVLWAGTLLGSLLTRPVSAAAVDLGAVAIRPTPQCDRTCLKACVQDYYFAFSVNSTHDAPRWCQSAEAGQQNLIDNDGILNSLLKKLENAAADFGRGQRETAKNVLDALVQELEAQKGKHVAGKIVAPLLQDISVLRVSL